MLKTHWKLVSRLERAGDNLIIIAAFLLTFYTRDNISAYGEFFGISAMSSFKELGRIEDYFIVLGAAIPFYNAWLSLMGGYRSMRFSSHWRLLRVAAVSSVVVFFLLGATLFLLKIDLSRSFTAIFCLLCAVGHVTQRLIVLQLLRYFRAQGKNFRNLLIVGTGEQARNIFLEIAQQTELGIRVVGFVTLEQHRAVPQASLTEANQAPSSIYDLPARVLADRHTFEAALKRNAIDEVLFADFVEHFVVVRELAQISVEEGVRVTFAADMFSLGIFRSDTSYFGTTPLVHFNPSPFDTTQLFLKRCLDLFVSIVSVALLAPVLIMIVLTIKLDSPGPVFFRQRRVGLNGRTFVLLKFRSMVVGAEQQLSQIKSQNEMQGPAFKMANDPRVTRVGKFLRRYSLDELPQFLNVIKGDMSLVGPRPPLPEEVSLYERKQRRRLSMRPGLTCTWQVSGRNDIPDFDSWAALDLAYIDNWSLKNDLRLLMKTIPAVLSGSGAR